MRHASAQCAAVLAGLIALAGGACALLPHLGGEVSMTAAQLTDRVARRFPIERSMAGLLEAQLSAPFVSLDESRNRVACDFKLSVKLALSSKTMSGSVKVSGRPEYEAATRSLYLREARVEQVRFEDMNDVMAVAVTKAASALAKDLLDGKPLHVFKTEDFNRLGSRFEPETLAIRGDKLVLTLKK
ncbi:MAG: DUF1439 domain-containing protein [Betaproteobacteria bacterium]|nr:DUF1439 domain-containing protein [Betaproteobacteria bacterium]